MISAHRCAVLSAIAYDDDPAPRLAAVGFDLLVVYDVGGTQAILVADNRYDGRNALVWPGSAEAEDWRTDARFVKTDYPGGGRAHLGFCEAFDKVRDAIAGDLRNLPMLPVFTGHSLGGALTIFSAVEWKAAIAHVFGCPRTGNREFVDRVQCRVVRHTNWFDAVTRSPPLIGPIQAAYAIGQGRRPTLYRHAGTMARTPGFGHRIGRYVKATA